MKKCNECNRLFFESNNWPEGCDTCTMCRAFTYEMNEIEKLLESNNHEAQPTT